MKTRLYAALLAVSSLTAFAQSVSVDVDDDGVTSQAQVQVPGMNVQMRVNNGAQPLDGPPPPPNQAARPRAPRPPPVQVVGVDTFDLRFEMSPQETLRLLSPEGARADVWADDGQYVGGFDVPCEVRARAGQFYRVVMTFNGALVFDRKVELRQYHRTNVVARGPAGTIIVPNPQPQPPSGGRVMGMVDFPALLAAVKEESFSDGKLTVLRTAEGAMTVDQLGELLDAFDFSGDKVKAVEICRDRLVDRQNAFKLYKRFDFDSDKQKVKAILGK